MKILLITDEEWNDFVFGNGILTNWFTGFNAEFAQIYCSPGKPLNSICNHYFQITDGQMLNSLLGRRKAGGVIMKKMDAEHINSLKQNAQCEGIYGFMKKVSIWFHTPVMILRDFIWCTGRYNKEGLEVFVKEFNPDVVFCPRYITPKLMRLEKLISGMTSAPFVAFTADDEASLDGVSYSPLYWVRRSLIHYLFKKHISIYSHYFMFSVDQAKEYKNEYGINSETLYKCGTFRESFISKKVGKPIRMVYAGRLYCNRWKSLVEIGKALKEINKNEVRMVLDVYTTEQLTKAQETALSKDCFIYVKGKVTPSELMEVYHKADIALHVESMDKKNRLLTRVSFSTKIIDLMASSCAILAICWEKHAGYQYLKEKDAGFCLSSYDNILPLLYKISDNPSLIQKYAEKAYNCGKIYHDKEAIQRQLKMAFEKILHSRNNEFRTNVKKERLW